MRRDMGRLGRRTGRVIACGVLCLLTLPSGPAQGQRIPLSVTLPSRGYKVVARRMGVAAYRNRGTNLIRIAAEGRLGAKPDAVLRALLDYQRHARALARVAESRILRRGDGWLLVYQRLSLPVVSDRDFTLKVSWGRLKEGTQWIRFRVHNQGGPAQRKGVVRVHHHQGYWQLKSVDRGAATFARVQVSSDMAGWLPRWMTRSHAGKDLPDLFAAMRRLAARQQAAGGGNKSRASAK